MERLRAFIKKVPIMREAARAISGKLASAGRKNFNSAEYWERRYASGRNSGPGSYNRLAEFKADVLNGFVADNAVNSVLELGSGDGAQLRLAKYPNYIGVDVSPSVLETARREFASDVSKRFIHLDEIEGARADLTLSLDVIYHLVEDHAFESHMRELFDRADCFVIIYASNTDENADSTHVRHRKFSDWVQRHALNFEFVERIDNAFPFDKADQDNTSFADFYIYRRTG